MQNFERGSEWRKWDLHLHTRSSYDYEYKGEDSDELLVKALKENNISAVAITDHFIIDSARIENLRKLAPEIVFFPGVELRTDKGASNLHIIAIFDCDKDLKELEDDFNAIMLRDKAKSKDDNEKVYWDFNDIYDFTKNRKGILSVHAGKKSNGLDQMISNKLPVGQAIKEEYADKVDIFEMSRLKEIEEYKNIVFKDIKKEKPMIICSDNHNPKNYSSKENLWIKADLTFNGLLQCLYQPNERVYVGTTPPKLDKINQNTSNYIDEVKIKINDDPKNKKENWFNCNLKLNPSLIAIIGNKGSGKSALSDIIALGCNSKNMKEASFLNNKRFLKSPKKLADDYEMCLTWKDGNIDKVDRLSNSINEEYTIENAQYLPQKHIENICNDLDNDFQDEINRVIFSYVDDTEKGDSKNFQQLISFKTENIKKAIDELQLKLKDINRTIINDENMKTSDYKKELENNLRKREKDLERLEKSKPKEVKKPTKKQNEEYEEKLKTLNEQIKKINEDILDNENELKKLKDKVTSISNIEFSFNDIKEKIDEINESMKIYAKDLELKPNELEVKVNIPQDIIEAKKLQVNKSIIEIEKKFNEEIENSLINQKNKLLEKKDKLISETDNEEKEYQKYLSDLENWKNNKLEIIGDISKENSIEALKKDLHYINNDLEKDYEKHKNERLKLIEQIYSKKQDIVKVYEKIYLPVNNEIKRILNKVDNQINFKTNMLINDKRFGEKILNYISKNYAGIFSSKTNPINTINNMITNTDFNKIGDVKKFINGVLECIYEDIDNSSKKIKNKEEFYQLLCDLDYIDVTYTLKVGDSSIQELSPGERGIVLLIFYLALNQNDIPIIIDQPEDNLDNQSVYDKLVPCICEAKKKRQVIIVTHNPNIAVACDAEQIIYCNMNKSKNEISYISGSIENNEIRKKVIDVLEGTMPAFDLRKMKYLS